MPAAPVVVVPTSTVAEVPGVPGVPVSPLTPCGIPKSNLAADVVPTLVTVASEPAARVDVLPTSTVAAAPGLPSSPAVPGVPSEPAGPAGILKSKIAAVGVLPAASVTLADCPAGRVSVLPAATVGVTPSVPSLPGLP